MTHHVWQYQGHVREIQGGDGPSDPDGQQTFGLVTDRLPVRRLLAGAATLLAVSAGPLDEPVVADTSTDWFTQSAVVRPVSRVLPAGGVLPPDEPAPAADASTEWFTQPAEVRPRHVLRPSGWIGDPDLDASAGPSDPEGLYTFDLVQAPDRLTQPPRPFLGHHSGDLHTEAPPDVSTDWLPSFPDRLNRARLPHQGGWMADADLGASAGPSDPDGQHTFGLWQQPPIWPARQPLKGLVAADLEAIEVDRSTEWIPSYPDRLDRGPFPSLGTATDPNLGESAGPSDGPGDFTYQLASYPDLHFRLKRLGLTPFWAGEVDTDGPLPNAHTSAKTRRNVHLTADRRNVDLTGKRRNIPIGS